MGQAGHLLGGKGACLRGGGMPKTPTNAQRCANAALGHRGELVESQLSTTNRNRPLSYAISGVESTRF